MSKFNDATLLRDIASRALRHAPPEMLFDEQEARQLFRIARDIERGATSAPGGTVQDREIAERMRDLAFNHLKTIAELKRSQKHPLGHPFSGGIVDGALECVASTYDNAAVEIRGIPLSRAMSSASDVKKPPKVQRRDDYHGWQIEHNPPPIPCRNFDWSATHPDFDGDGDSRQVFGKSWDAVRAEIDAWHEENAP